MRFLSNFPAEVLILTFLSITYVMSSFEKITDFKGNVTFIKAHFKSSPLQKYVSQLLIVLLILEVLASTLMLFGIYQLYTSEKKEIALLGTQVSAIVLLFLLIGQRLAKDYQGAMSLTVYFTLTVFAVFLLNN
ncbi:DoxX family protein [Polaribacter tangerinus]|uniref:DoxX family protein n=1 Tax=Polaribacter tangerinus TaxID=1920034 RepID=UPI000B4B350D|nr:DoxX family protein [Polaribacter tangerinus]